MSEVNDDLAVRALPPLMQATSLVNANKIAPVRGRVDLTPLAQAAPKVMAAEAAVQSAVRRLGASDSGALVESVAVPLADLRAQVGKVATTTGTAARAVRLLPPMLGADGPRSYLMLVQNNAELRATGGEVGSVVLLRATDGRIQVAGERTGGSLARLSTPPLPLSTQEQALFGRDFGVRMADVTLTPDFPRSGQLAQAIWKKQVGGDVDGVLSIDPGALAGVLGATGPVTLPTGQQLTGDIAVQFLLNTVYQVADPELQEAFFAATAASVFNTVIAGQREPARTFDALAKAAREGRVMVWSAHEQEQALLSGTVLSGELAGARGDSPVVGVYLNDNSEAKIGYYLRSDVVATTKQCRSDGSQLLSVKLTLKSTAPVNPADLPPYISLGGSIVPRGEVRTNVLFYAPTGGRVNNVRFSSGKPGIFSQTHNGLGVVGRTVQLQPGQRLVIDYDVLTGRGQRGTPVLRVTPITFGKALVNGRLSCT
jgi:hypothetical protein